MGVGLGSHHDAKTTHKKRLITTAKAFPLAFVFVKEGRSTEARCCRCCCCHGGFTSGAGIHVLHLFNLPFIHARCLADTDREFE